MLGKNDDVLKYFNYYKEEQALKKYSLQKYYFFLCDLCHA